ncbi:hypothetical protein AB1Y20_019908 [Prymnesium parvum]|uniref:Uncharacterized protein n=1 Tax=Prymnesium parvum TaxID=97485 RepID=A0AB34JTP1_PRYPA
MAADAPLKGKAAPRPGAQSSVKLRGWRHIAATVEMQSLLSDFKVKAKVKEAMTVDTSHVVTAVSDEDLRSRVPKFLQGHSSFNVEHRLVERFRLRLHPLVREALEPWWHTAQHSMRAAGGDGERISRQEYIRIFTCVFTAMVEDSFNESEAIASAQEDWERDSKGNATMGRNDFLDALFELADMWTDTIGAEEYASFLNLTLKSVTQMDGDHLTWKATVNPGAFFAELTDMESKEGPRQFEHQPKVLKLMSLRHGLMALRKLQALGRGRVARMRFKHVKQATRVADIGVNGALDQGADAVVSRGLGYSCDHSNVDGAQRKDCEARPGDTPGDIHSINMTIGGSQGNQSTNQGKEGARPGDTSGCSQDEHATNQGMDGAACPGDKACGSACGSGVDGSSIQGKDDRLEEEPSAVMLPRPPPAPEGPLGSSSPRKASQGRKRREGTQGSAPEITPGTRRTPQQVGQACPPNSPRGRRITGTPVKAVNLTFDEAAERQGAQIAAAPWRPPSPGEDEMPSLVPTLLAEFTSRPMAVSTPAEEGANGRVSCTPRDTMGTRHYPHPQHGKAVYSIPSNTGILPYTCNMAMDYVLSQRVREMSPRRASRPPSSVSQVHAPRPAGARGRTPANLLFEVPLVNGEFSPPGWGRSAQAALERNESTSIVTHSSRSRVHGVGGYKWSVKPAKGGTCSNGFDKGVPQSSNPTWETKKLGRPEWVPARNSLGRVES